MHKIRTINNISEKGLSRFPADHYELGDAITDPEVILVRSQQLTDDDAVPSLRAVGRAGAGVNNIPVADYTDKGIVVFNTPGANARSDGTASSSVSCWLRTRMTSGSAMASPSS